MSEPHCPACEHGCSLCASTSRSWGGVLEGDVLTRLAELRPESVNCVVTSPPYWSLRKYDAPDVTWPGSDPTCDHKLEGAGVGGESYEGARRWQHEGVSRQETPDAWVAGPVVKDEHHDFGTSTLSGPNKNQMEATTFEAQSATCSRCGAWRGQFGLEPTRELYIEHSMMVLRALRRVLRKDGLIWWNLDDARGHRTLCHDLIPERFLLAAEADGWLVCSKNIWAKPNAMPESAKRRPTDAHENVFMLAKHPSYWYDQEAVREPSTSPEQEAHNQRYAKPYAAFDDRAAETGQPGNVNNVGIHSRPGPGGRNLRSVWTFPTAQTPIAHFATFPPELPRRCISASCPREVCQRCGMARVRLMESEPSPIVDTEEYSQRRDEGNPGRGFMSATPRYATESSTIGWSDCGCGTWNCASCGFVLEYSHAQNDTMPGMPHPIPSETAEPEVLRDGLQVPGPSPSSPSDNVPPMRQPVPAEGSSGEAQPPVLPEAMLSKVDSGAPSINEGLEQNNAGLHPRASAESSESERGRLRDAASASDGETSGKTAQAKRGRKPQERRQGRQPDRQPGTDDQAAARQAGQATSKAPSVPSLREDDPHYETGNPLCPSCGSRLTFTHAPYNPGIVLDCFAGVGTTLYVARQLGRRFLGIELSPAYAEMARQKLSLWWDPPNLAPRPAPAGQGALL